MLRYMYVAQACEAGLLATSKSNLAQLNLLAHVFQRLSEERPLPITTNHTRYRKAFSYLTFESLRVPCGLAALEFDGQG